MAKFVLDIEDVEDYDFGLIGISCHSKDYRISRELNKSLRTDFARTSDYKLDEQSFSFYQYFDEENHIDYYFIANRSKTGFLIPEQKTVDYFLIFKENYSEEQLKEFIWKINDISLVLTSFKIDPLQLKSKQNLLF